MFFGCEDGWGVGGRVEGWMDGVGHEAPNMPYLHTGLHGGVEKDGLDLKRLRPGYVIWYTTPSLVKKNIDHNIKISNNMYPPLYQDKMNKASLGCTHITLLFRLYKAGSVSPLTGKKFTVDKDDEGMRYILEKHHKYWVLDEKITPDEAMLLSDWMNADQNQNFGNDPSHIIRSIARICAQQMLVRPHPGSYCV